MTSIRRAPRTVLAKQLAIMVLAAGCMGEEPLTEPELGSLIMQRVRK